MDYCIGGLEKGFDSGFLLRGLSSLDPHKDTDLVKGERKLTCYGKLLFKGT
jgi:hypothetical protein